MPFGMRPIAGTCLSMAVLAAAVLLPVAAVDTDRCDEIRKKMNRGAGLTNSEQNEYMSCPNGATRRPVTSLPKRKDTGPSDADDPRRPEGADADRPSGDAAGDDGFP